MFIVVQAGAISPQFMFLQLYQAAGLTAACTDKPLLLPNSKSIESSLKILDRIFCYETHKVGVVYVGHGQVTDEQAILRNQFGCQSPTRRCGCWWGRSTVPSCEKYYCAL